ncbi:Uncharacterised protein g5806 [Pycnogonum litorale]
MATADTQSDKSSVSFEKCKEYVPMLTRKVDQLERKIKNNYDADAEKKVMMLKNYLRLIKGESTVRPSLAQKIEKVLRGMTKNSMKKSMQTGEPSGLTDRFRRRKFTPPADNSKNIPQIGDERKITEKLMTDMERIHSETLQVTMSMVDKVSSNEDSQDKDEKVIDDGAESVVITTEAKSDIDADSNQSVIGQEDCSVVPYPDKKATYMVLELSVNKWDKQVNVNVTDTVTYSRKMESSGQPLDAQSQNVGTDDCQSNKNIRGDSAYGMDSKNLGFDQGESGLILKHDEGSACLDESSDGNIPSKIDRVLNEKTEVEVALKNLGETKTPNESERVTGAPSESEMTNNNSFVFQNPNDVNSQKLDRDDVEAGNDPASDPNAYVSDSAVDAPCVIQSVTSLNPCEVTFAGLDAKSNEDDCVRQRDGESTDATTSLPASESSGENILLNDDENLFIGIKDGPSLIIPNVDSTVSADVAGDRLSNSDGKSIEGARNSSDDANVGSNAELDCYHCEVCPALKFRRKSDLRHHLYGHAGIRICINENCECKNYEKPGANNVTCGLNNDNMLKLKHDIEEIISDLCSELISRRSDPASNSNKRKANNPLENNSKRAKEDVDDDSIANFDGHPSYEIKEESAGDNFNHCGSPTLDVRVIKTEQQSPEHDSRIDSDIVDDASVTDFDGEDVPTDDSDGDEAPPNFIPEATTGISSRERAKTASPHSVSINLFDRFAGKDATESKVKNSSKDHKKLLSSAEHYCPYCGYIRPSRASLQQHIYRHYTDYFPLRCSHCDNGFYRLGDLKLHNKNYHPSRQCHSYFIDLPSDPDILLNLKFRYPVADQMVFISEKFKCQQCNTIANPSKLEQHFCSKHPSFVPLMKEVNELNILNRNLDMIFQKSVTKDTSESNSPSFPVNSRGDTLPSRAMSPQMPVLEPYAKVPTLDRTKADLSLRGVSNIEGVPRSSGSNAEKSSSPKQKNTARKSTAAPQLRRRCVAVKSTAKRRRNVAVKSTSARQRNDVASTSESGNNTRTRNGISIWVPALSAYMMLADVKTMFDIDGAKIDVNDLSYTLQKV